MLKTLKRLKWMWVPMLCAAVLSGCNDSTSGSATDGSAATHTGGGASTTPTSRNATLSWQAPTTNTNGSALTDLSGYRIYYGSNANDLSQSVTINSVGVQTYVFDDLAPGTWYFAVMAVTSSGAESTLSNVVETTIG